MVRNIQYSEKDGTYYYYAPRSASDAENGFCIASAVSGLIMSTLPYFSKPFQKQMVREHSNNHLYKNNFLKAIDISGLKSKGLSLGNYTLDKDIYAGMNACYVPSTKTIKVNTELASISGFHELGHAMNHLKSKSGKFLQALRKPGYGLAGLMGTLALLSRPKPKEEKRTPLDFVLDNCGKIAFVGLLPTVAEEALASHKGIKLARASGLDEKLVKNLKKFYGKALLSYIGYAVVTGFSVFVANKITQAFTRPKKVIVYNPQDEILSTSLPSSS